MVLAHRHTLSSMFVHPCFHGHISLPWSRKPLKHQCTLSNHTQISSLFKVQTWVSLPPTGNRHTAWSDNSNPTMSRVEKLSYSQSFWGPGWVTPRCSILLGVSIICTYKMSGGEGQETILSVIIKLMLAEPLLQVSL